MSNTFHCLLFDFYWFGNLTVGVILGPSLSSFEFVYFKLLPFQLGINNCSQNDIFHQHTILLDVVSCLYGWPWN